MIQVKTQVNLLLPLWLQIPADIRLGLHTLVTTGDSSRCWNALYIYELDLLWLWQVLAASIITYSMIQVNLLSTLTVNPSILYHVGVASIWPLAAVACAETYYISMNLIFYEYDKPIGASPRRGFNSCWGHVLYHVGYCGYLVQQLRDFGVKSLRKPKMLCEI